MNLKWFDRHLPALIPLNVARKFSNGNGLCIATGVQHATIFGTQAYGLPLGEATTPQYLKSLGYRTHGVGKVNNLLEVHNYL